MPRCLQPVRSSSIAPGPPAAPWTLFLLIPGVLGCGEPPPVPADTVLHPTLPGEVHRPADPHRDVGSGFLRVVPDPAGPPGTAPPQTIRIRSAPDPGAELIARARHLGDRLVVETGERGLRDGGLEVGYEERAFPVLEETPEGWVRVGFASDDAGETRSGWVDAGDPALERVHWEAWLADGPARGPLWFPDPEEIAFFDGPEGGRLEPDLVPGAGGVGLDYALYPLRTEGPWMRVRVVSPSDYCREPDELDTERLETTAWIRYLDPEGRPAVWYFTRGC